MNENHYGSLQQSHMEMANAMILNLAVLRLFIEPWCGSCSSFQVLSAVTFMGLRSLGGTS